MQRKKQEKSRQNESPASPGTSPTFCRATARCFGVYTAFADAYVLLLQLQTPLIWLSILKLTISLSMMNPTDPP
jgi:hypothetical protein